jgi:hypothetical protein
VCADGLKHRVIVPAAAPHEFPKPCSIIRLDDEARRFRYARLKIFYGLTDGFSLRLLAPSLAVIAILTASVASTAPSAQSPGAAFPKGKYAALNALPDWGGIWILNRPNMAAGTRPPGPALKGQYLKDYEAWQRAVKENNGDAPRDGSNCRPPGFPMMMMVPQYPIEFLFTPGRVTVHHEAWMQWRSIYTDGRTHPQDLDPTFNGDSIGTWRDGVLEVETIGIKSIVQISLGMKHSDKLRVTERLHLAKDDPDTLLDEMTLDDPEALDKPWTTTLSWKRTRDDQLIEFICAENDRNPVDASGHTSFQ